MRTFIRLASLYRRNVTLSGPLFLKVNQNGAILQSAPLVSVPVCLLLLNLIED